MRAALDWFFGTLIILVALVTLPLWLPCLVGRLYREHHQRMAAIEGFMSALKQDADTFSSNMEKAFRDGKTGTN